MKRRDRWLMVRLDRLADRTGRLGWRWLFDPRRRRHCLFTPTGRCYDLHARPRLGVTRHRTVTEHLI